MYVYPGNICGGLAYAGFGVDGPEMQDVSEMVLRSICDSADDMFVVPMLGVLY